MSPDWEFESICDYFEDDELLRPLGEDLNKPFTATDFGEYIFSIWKVASKEQFAWFINTFESKLWESDSEFSEKAMDHFETISAPLS